MNLVLKSICIALLAATLSACATTGGPSAEAEIDRISPAELEKLIPPAVATVSLDELVADSKQGKTPDELIAKIKASNSRYELTPEQALALNKQGLDIKVLNYIHEANALARQNAMADEMNKRQQAQAQTEKNLKRQRDLARSRFYDPFWGGYYGHPWFGPIGPRPYGLRHPFYGSRFGWGLGFGW